MIVSIDGKLMSDARAVVSVFDRAFLYGDGLFETIRFFGDRPFRWTQHMNRLRAGMTGLRFEVEFDDASLRKHALKLWMENGQPDDSVLRINLSRGVGLRGYSPKGADDPTMVLSFHPLKPAALPNARVITATVRIPAADPLAAFKHCSKLHHVLARAQADDAAADEALLLNTDGFLADGTSSNVFCVFNGELWTPPLSASALPGICRAAILELAPSLNIPVHEQNISPEHLRSLEGIFLCNVVRGIVEVTELDAAPIPNSPLAQTLKSALHDLITRETT